MKLIIFLYSLLLCVYLSQSKDFVVGTRANNLLISTQKVVSRAFPLLRRGKDYVYVDSKERIIKGVIARDLSRTKAEVSLVEGGIGATNVSLHFESERGEGLNYLVLIFSRDMEPTYY